MLAANVILGSLGRTALLLVFFITFALYMAAIMQRPPE
jgi:hypothetical protein